MKIAAVDCWMVDVPLQGSYKVAGRAKSTQRSIVVRIRTADDLEGAGNVDPSAGYSKLLPEESFRLLREQLAPALLGQDARSVRGCLRLLERSHPDACEATAALEMALLDLNGKALGVPVHRLLGGAVRDSIPLNGWIGILTPAEAAAEAASLVARGFISAKIKVGGDVAADTERVAAVRDAAPQMALRVDGNEGFDVERALALARAIAPCDIALFEQPVPRDDLEGMVRIRKAIAMPLMADESIYDPATLMAVIRAGAADIIKVKVMKQGGLYRTLEAIETCRAAGIPCVLGHGFGLTLHTLAELHVHAASDNLLDACEAVGPLKMTGDVVATPLPMPGGSVPVPQEPGLGAALAPDALDQYAAA